MEGFDKLRFKLTPLAAGQTMAAAIGANDRERLVFVQSSKPVLIGHEALNSWDCVALPPGEAANIKAMADTLVYVVEA